MASYLNAHYQQHGWLHYTKSDWLRAGCVEGNDFVAKSSLCILWEDCLGSPTVAETKMDEHFPLDDDDNGGDDDRVLIPCPSAMILDQDSQRDGNAAATSKAQESNHPAPPSPSLLQQLLCDKVVQIRDNYPEIGLKKLLKELKVSRSTVFPTGLLCGSCARIVNNSVHMHKY